MLTGYGQRKAVVGVCSSPDELLLQLENALRREASKFARKAFEAGFEAEQPEHLVEKVTGIAVLDSSSAEAAHITIRRKLAGERRRARRGSALYDLNRHISLSRALDALARLEVRQANPGGPQDASE